jgi:hypothetical protein
MYMGKGSDIMRGVYMWLGRLIALGVLLQAMFIALGFFTVAHEIDDGTVFDKNYVENHSNFGLDMHGLFGTLIIPVLVLLFLIVSFFAKVPGGAKWAGFTFLAVVVQIVLAFTAFGVPAVGALHGLNAFIVLGLAAYSARRAQNFEAVGSTTAAPAAAV